MTFQYVNGELVEEKKEESNEVFTLGEHQIRAINHFCNHPFGLLCYATGTGKSLTIISTMLAQIQKKIIDKGLICCTLGSIDEVKNDCYKFYKYTPIDITSIGDLLKWIKSKEHPIALTRYEWLKNIAVDGINDVLKLAKIGIAFDEAQRIKSSGYGKIEDGTKTAYYSYKLTRKAASIISITATPMTVSLDDLWGIMYVTDKNTLDSYNNFCDEYYVRKLEPLPFVKLAKTCRYCGSPMVYKHGMNICINQTPCKPDGKRNIQKIKSQWNIISYKNYNQLAAKMSNSMICYFPKQDIRFHTVNVTLSQQSMQKYVEIVNDMVQYIKTDEHGNQYVSDDPMPWGTRRVQLQYAVDKAPEKLAALIKTIREHLDTGCVLYIHYHESIKNVTDELDLQQIQYRLYTGKQSKAERADAKKWFVADAKNKVLIISQAGGASLNLQATDTFIYYSQPDSFGTYSQSMGRIVRLYSKFKTFHIYFVNAEDSIDICKMQWLLAHKDIMYEVFNNRLIPENIPSLELTSEVKRWLKERYLWHGKLRNY